MSAESTAAISLLPAAVCALMLAIVLAVSIRRR